MAEMERYSVDIVRHFSVLLKTSELEILFTFLTIFFPLANFAQRHSKVSCL